MPFFPAFLRRAAWFPVVLFLLAGCGKKDNPVGPDPGLSQAQADEIAQQASVMMAVKLGGWLYEVQSTILSIPQNGSPTARGGPVAVERDTTVMTAQISESIHYDYRLSGGGLAATWSPSAVGIDATSSASGTISTLSERHDGPYWHRGDFAVDGIQGDTLTFHGTLVDSSLARIRNYFTAEIRFYYMNVHIAHSFEILKDPTEHPLPLNGRATLTIHADQLDSLDRNAVIQRFDVVCTVQFDGTFTAPMTLVGDPADPRTIYHYRAHLADGGIERAASTPAAMQTLSGRSSMR